MKGPPGGADDAGNGKRAVEELLLQRESACTTSKTERKTRTYVRMGYE